MYIRNNTIAVIFRVMLLIACGAGIVMTFMYTGFGVDVIMSDFAILSNFMTLIYTAYLIIARPGYERGIFRGAVTIYMIVTFIVYYFVYFGISSAMPDQLSAAGYLLYFVAPVMTSVDYLLFCRKGEFTPYNPVIWALVPVLFNVVVFLIKKLGFSAATMPYFNLMGMNMTITLLVFLGISYLLFVLDNMMAGRRR